jgi:hypothetical protein
MVCQSRYTYMHGKNLVFLEAEAVTAGGVFSVPARVGALSVP